ncbi:MAG: LamG-like jellyroll fold domain-containing protein [Limisphaerales bacterium]
MSLPFPSSEFDHVVAAVCHGEAGDDEMRALNELLRSNAVARDEYLLRVELHSRLASEADLFAATSVEIANARLPGPGETVFPRIVPESRRWFGRRPMVAWGVGLGLAACFLILAAVGVTWLQRPGPRTATSTAVAVLSQAVAPRWQSRAEARPVGAALEPGWLRLKSGLLQVTFYSGARLVIEGPAQVELVAAGEAFCQAGRVTAVVPPAARGFRVDIPQGEVTDRGTEFGLDVRPGGAEVHVFAGEVDYQGKTAPNWNLKEGRAAVVGEGGVTRETAADPAAFGPLLDLERNWQAMLARRYDDWRAASARQNQDPSLRVRFDFEDFGPSRWMLPNAAAGAGRLPEATIVGCQATEGRWPGKQALEFRSMSDRVRFTVPGEFRALTMSAWVNVKGLDREFNSLFLCDGFRPGTIHWQIRHDGALDLGVQGDRALGLQILVSPAVVGFNQFGQWLHLAVVVDGGQRRVVHYVNGAAVSRHALKRPPPYRIGAAELGNWNPGRIPHKPPFLIRHFSGAMDEFALFGRALDEGEIRQLYSEGTPQPEPGRVAFDDGLDN